MSEVRKYLSRIEQAPGFRQRKELALLGKQAIQRAKDMRRSRRKRMERRQKARPFTEEEGRRLWDDPRYDQPLSEVGPVQASSRSMSTLITLILGSGPSTPVAIARRAAAAAVNLQLISAERAGKLVGCHAQTIRRLAKTLS